MEQKELYHLAGQLSDKEVAYLMAAHLEHMKRAEFGFTIDTDKCKFVGDVKYVPLQNDSEIDE